MGKALAQLDALAAAGVTTAELSRHYVLNQEFMWRVVARGAPTAQAVTLFDLEGVSMAMLAGQVSRLPWWSCLLCSCSCGGVSRGRCKGGGAARKAPG